MGEDAVIAVAQAQAAQAMAIVAVAGIAAGFMILRMYVPLFRKLYEALQQLTLVVTDSKRAEDRTAQELVALRSELRDFRVWIGVKFDELPANLQQQIGAGIVAQRGRSKPSFLARMLNSASMLLIGL